MRVITGETHVALQQNVSTQQISRSAEQAGANGPPIQQCTSNHLALFMPSTSTQPLTPHGMSWGSNKIKERFAETNQSITVPLWLYNIWGIGLEISVQMWWANGLQVQLWKVTAWPWRQRATRWNTSPWPSCCPSCPRWPWGWSWVAGATGRSASAPESCCARCMGFLWGEGDEHLSSRQHCSFSSPEPSRHRLKKETNKKTQALVCDTLRTELPIH